MNIDLRLEVLCSRFYPPERILKNSDSYGAYYKRTIVISDLIRGMYVHLQVLRQSGVDRGSGNIKRSKHTSIRILDRRSNGTETIQNFLSVHSESSFLSSFEFLEEFGEGGDCVLCLLWSPQRSRISMVRSSENSASIAFPLAELCILNVASGLIPSPTVERLLVSLKRLIEHVP